jgi:Na+/H+-translocating membrane pyrophosphatase
MLVSASTSQSTILTAPLSLLVVAVVAAVRLSGIYGLALAGVGLVAGLVAICFQVVAAVV